MDYLLLKAVHQTAVALSVTGFVVRGLASLQGAAWVHTRAARTLPHAVDTVLLLSALGLAWLAELNPLHTPWLLAKLIALPVYIGLGMLALRPALPIAQRRAAWLAALLTLAYIVSVALRKTPLGLLGLLG